MPPIFPTILGFLFGKKLTLEKKSSNVLRTVVLNDNGQENPVTAQWIFPINDGSSSDIIISCENNQRLYWSRVDPLSPGSVSLTLIPTDHDGLISDHWHIFAHGYHWISYAVPSKSACYLLQLDTSFTLRWKAVVDATGKKPTNDHFLVETSAGAAVGIFDGLNGHEVHTFYASGTGGPTKIIGGASNPHSNTASGRYSSTAGIEVLAPDQTYYPGMKAASSINVFTLSSGISITGAVKPLVAGAGSGAVYNMPVMERPGNFRIITCKHIDLASAPAAPNDYGTIMRFVFSADWKRGLSSEKLDTDKNRPHTCTWGSYLITGWDDDGKIGPTLRADKMS